MPPENYIFSEIQKFINTWVGYIVLLLGFATVVLSGASLIFQGTDSTVHNSELYITFLLSLAVSVLIVGLIWFARLEVYLNNDGIFYRFLPFIFNFKNIKLAEIETYNFRKYSPIFEYGGWGIRYAFKNGWAFNVSGNMGLQIVKKDKKRILFGTQKPNEFFMALDSLIKNRKQG
jgi:hypothetical protein